MTHGRSRSASVGYAIETTSGFLSVLASNLPSSACVVNVAVTAGFPQITERQSGGVSSAGPTDRPQRHGTVRRGAEVGIQPGHGQGPPQGLRAAARSGKGSVNYSGKGGGGTATERRSPRHHSPRPRGQRSPHPGLPRGP